MRAPNFWYDTTPTARLLSALLSPLGAVYGASVKRRERRANPAHPGIPVICVGNLTAGGSGKTPIAIAIAQILAAHGAKPAFLSRGYGGHLAGPVQVDPRRHTATEVGDEPLLLAAHAPAVVARNRREGAKFARAIGAGAIVMDDGFQNFEVAKDLSLVVVDAVSGFGNGGLIPAGPLRESPRGGLARADAVVVVGDGSPEMPPFPQILRAKLVATAPEAIRGRTVFAFAGIGRPEKFFTMLSAQGARLAGTQSYPDHHRYTSGELHFLREIATRARASLVTTEKDYVRIAPGERKGIVPVPVHAAFENGAIAGLLDRVIANGE
jgi:tetraacyldisaccharide 4'-kinase